MLAIPDGTEIAGTYRVEARLGSGAFGSVYRVNHRFLGRMALKLLEVDAATVDRVAAEGAAHASLFHPNITRVFEVNVAHISGDMFVYIASEYVASGDLDAYLRNTRRLGLDECGSLAQQLLRALDYAHSRPSPVFHRDVKPANVLVGGGSTPTFKLGDFGVSAEARDDRTTAAHGTLAFQAPECSFGSYVAQSDLYGAAVVLYRALTGTYPFPLTGSIEDIRRSKENPQRPSRFRPDISNSLDVVMLRALAPNPFDRFNSAVAFTDAFIDTPEYAGTQP